MVDKDAAKAFQKRMVGVMNDSALGILLGIGDELGSMGSSPAMSLRTTQSLVITPCRASARQPHTTQASSTSSSQACRDFTSS